jgi:AcrR family transcriptional regulator
MSPRTYELGQRRAQIDEGRRRVIEAARGLLAEATSYTAFTVDAVAKRADVARATVYYQFGSKIGLLEAVCDGLAEEGQITHVAEAFTHPDPHESLRRIIAHFARFWAADRTVMRRLRALAALDPEVQTVIAARDDRRRQMLRVLVRRVVDQPDYQLDALPEDLVGILQTLTSFETFDSLAGPDRTPTDVVPVVIDLAQGALPPNSS